jgi:hypothetical protein
MVRNLKTNINNFVQKRALATFAWFLSIAGLSLTLEKI